MRYKSKPLIEQVIDIEHLKKDFDYSGIC